MANFDPEIREDIDALIAEAAAQVALVEEMYEDALTEQRTSGTLRVRIKNVLENQRSALDYLANGLHEALGGAASKQVYYPIARAPKDFPSLIKGQLPSVPPNTPLYDAIQGRQSFNVGYEWLGHLAALTRQNKHHRLTPQIRDETRRVQVEIRDHGSVDYQPYQEGKGGVTFGPGAYIGGAPVDPVTQRPRPSPGTTVTEQVFVDWLFDDPPISALGTLQQIQAGLSMLVHDVLSASGL